MHENFAEIWWVSFFILLSAKPHDGFVGEVGVNLPLIYTSDYYIEAKVEFEAVH